LVTPAAAPDPGETIGLVADVADGRGVDTGGSDESDPEAEPPEAEPPDPDPDEPDDFAVSLAESDEPDVLPDDCLPFWPELPFWSVPDLLSVSAGDSGAFGSGFFRTTVSG
jgi:hypothetical protein